LRASPEPALIRRGVHAPILAGGQGGRRSLLPLPRLAPTERPVPGRPCSRPAAHRRPLWRRGIWSGRGSRFASSLVQIGCAVRILLQRVALPLWGRLTCWHGVGPKRRDRGLPATTGTIHAPSTAPIPLFSVRFRRFLD